MNICCIQETHAQDGKPFKKERNNTNARAKKKYMEEAEYLVVQVTIRDRALYIVNYYCPNDKNLSLDTIQTKENNFLMVGDFNSQSQSWSYSIMDKQEKL